MDLSFLGLDSPLLNAYHQHLVNTAEYSDKARNLKKKSYMTEDSDKAGNLTKKRYRVDVETDKARNLLTRCRVRDAKATTPADVMEYPDSYVVIVDIPGLKSGDMNVQVEEENVLVISGERKREEEKEGTKYVRKERSVGKFIRKFTLPENSNTDAVSAVCKDGVLTVTVQKLPPPEPKKPKTIEVQVA